MKQEDRQSQGRKPTDKRKARRCSACGKPGHNARTCQIDVETSNKENASKRLLVPVLWFFFLRKISTTRWYWVFRSLCNHVVSSPTCYLKTTLESVAVKMGIY